MNNRVLLGKRCVITGGSRGIGLAIAELFAAQGATCTLVGRNEAALSQAAARLRLTTATTTGGIRRSEDNDNDDHDHSTFAMDISNYSSWETLVARTKRVSHTYIYIYMCVGGYTRQIGRQAGRSEGATS